MPAPTSPSTSWANTVRTGEHSAAPAADYGSVEDFAAVQKGQHVLDTIGTDGAGLGASNLRGSAGSGLASSNSGLKGFERNRVPYFSPQRRQQDRCTPSR